MADNRITLYHATDPDNVLPIMKAGLKGGYDGCVYFCKTPEDSLLYNFMYNKTKHDVAVIPVTFTEEEFSAMGINIDNNPAYTPDAYCHEGSIPENRIPKSLDEILLYEVY